MWPAAGRAEPVHVAPPGHDGAQRVKTPGPQWRAMRPTVAMLVVATALSGCLAGDDSGDPVPEASVPPVAGAPDGHVTVPAENGTTTVPLDALPPWSLQLCDHGYRVVQPAKGSLAPPGDRACDFRVTKPMDDASTFDWRTQHGPANEVSLAVNPTDALNLVGGAKDYTVSYISDVAQCGEYTVWNGHFRSLDAGRTWENDLVPGFPGDDRDSPLQGNECNTDPVSVFDADGTYWHNGLNYRGAREDVGDPDNPLGNDGLVTGSQIFFARSPAGQKGEAFDRITFASFGDNEPTIFNDKNWLGVDPGSDHMIHTWTNFIGAAGVIQYVESFDAGATWTAPTNMPPGAGAEGVSGETTGAEVPAAFVQFSMPQYDSSGNVWVIWSGINGPVITHAERVDGTQPSAFVPPSTTVAYPEGGLTGGADGCLDRTQFRASVYPVLGIDTSGGLHDGRKYIAYPAAGATGAGVWVTHSDDGMAWSDPVEITAGLEDDQFMSWIDVGPDGTVHVTYYDCSVGAGGRDMTVGYMWSDDAGASWQGPFWVGQAAFDGDGGHHQSGAPFIGDYIAVDASETGVHFFWADARHTGTAGREAGSDVYAATLVRDWGVACMYAPELADDDPFALPDC